MMLAYYPGNFACPSRIEGHSFDAFAGLVRTPMEAGNTRQRRMHRALPQSVSLVFVMPQTDLADWLAWVNAYAWDNWFAMRLPGLLASRAGNETEPVNVRFSSDLSCELLNVSRLWYWRVRVTAEYLPTASDLVPFPQWIVATTPARAAALPFIRAGTPGVPSPDWIRAGTPINPSAPDRVSGTAS